MANTVIECKGFGPIELSEEESKKIAREVDRAIVELLTIPTPSQKG